MSFGCGDSSCGTRWKENVNDEMSKVGLGYEKGWLGIV